MFLNRELFIIAEIGANHNGDLELCKKMICKAKECGADAVKLQKRYNDKTFMKSILDSPYQSEYAKETGTYREHREYLDRFDYEEFKILQGVAQENDIILFATPFDFESVDFLASLNMPLFKVASCDFKNLPLIERIAKLNKPMILSTGGATYQEMKSTYSYLIGLQSNFAFLHCVSIYPNDDNLNLNCIRVMRKMFDIPIGFSTHHSAVFPNFLAYMCGARIFEAHFTLNRGYGGTDHGFSLEPVALRKLCYDIKRIPELLGNGIKIISDKEKSGFVRKFGKAIHPVKTILANQTITAQDIAIKAPAEGLPPYEYDNVLGKIAICDLSTNDILTWEKIK